MSVIEDSARPSFAALHIYDCKSTTSERTDFHDIPPVATFHLFALPDSSWFQSIGISCDCSGASVDVARYREYTPDPSLRLISLEIETGLSPPPAITSRSHALDIQFNNFLYGSLTVFVHAGTLEKRCLNVLDGVTAVVPWEEWSIDTRLFDADPEDHCDVQQISHKRCYLTQGWGPEWLYDFSSAAALRYALQTADASGPWEYFTESQVVESPFLRSAVVSALPYRRVRVTPDHGELRQGGHGLLLVEDCRVYSSTTLE